MKNRRPYFIALRALLLLLLAVGAAVPAFAQQGAPRDTSRQKEIDVDHADLFEYIQERDTVIQKLKGNVELRQDSVYMYCDTAIIKNKTHVFANGSVIIQQGDSLSVFSDSAVYDGLSRIADLYGEVIMVNGEQRLYTDRLTYNLATKLATYENGGTLTLGATQLTSRKGYYYVSDKMIFFKDSVVVIDTAFTLLADTLGFNTETRVVNFLGPTLITSDSTQLYCEDGFYDTENALAEFTINAQYQKGDQLAMADTIRYDGNRDLYILRGNATFQENSQVATADVIEYDQAADKTVLIGNARFRDEVQDIQADAITYDAKQETYFTRGRSRISDPPNILEADQVDYSEERGIGIAIGNVIWTDTSAELTIRCDTADYNRKTDYLKAFGGTYGRPLLITVLDGDSLYMAADTLLALREATPEAAPPASTRPERGERGSADGPARGARDSLTAAGKGPMLDSLGQAPPAQDSLAAVDSLPKDSLAASGMVPDVAEAPQGPLLPSLTDSLPDLSPVAAAEPMATASADSLAKEATLPLDSLIVGDWVALSVLEAVDTARTDSLTFAKAKTDTTAEEELPRVLRAYNDVRIYKSDMQAICDSLTYSTADSIFRLFQSPIVWADTSQFYADTIHIKLQDSKIDRIFLRNNGYIINSPDEVMFNQVKGKQITAFFEEDELRRMAVDGNAESVYYAIDEDGGYVGVNKTICSEMMLYFGDNQVERIKFFAQPKANMLPMGQVNHSEIRLEGFVWEEQYRPDSLPDLFSAAKARGGKAVVSEDGEGAADFAEALSSREAEVEVQAADFAEASSSKKDKVEDVEGAEDEVEDEVEVEEGRIILPVVGRPSGAGRGLLRPAEREADGAENKE